MVFNIAVRSNCGHNYCKNSVRGDHNRASNMFIPQSYSSTILENDQENSNLFWILESPMYQGYLF